MGDGTIHRLEDRANASDGYEGPARRANKPNTSKAPAHACLQEVPAKSTQCMYVQSPLTPTAASVLTHRFSFRHKKTADLLLCCTRTLQRRAVTSNHTDVARTQCTLACPYPATSRPRTSSRRPGLPVKVVQLRVQGFQRAIRDRVDVPSCTSRPS